MSVRVGQNKPRSSSCILLWRVLSGFPGWGLAEFSLPKELFSQSRFGDTSQILTIAKIEVVA